MAVIDRGYESPSNRTRLVSSIDLRHRRRCAARVELVQLLPLRFDAQRSIPIVYKGLTLDASYRIDLIIEDLIVVEVKSVAALAPILEAQGPDVPAAHWLSRWSADQLQRVALGRWGAAPGEPGRWNS